MNTHTLHTNHAQIRQREIPDCVSSAEVGTPSCFEIPVTMVTDGYILECKVQRLSLKNTNN